MVGSGISRQKSRGYRGPAILRVWSTEYVCTLERLMIQPQHLELWFCRLDEELKMAPSSWKLLQSYLLGWVPANGVLLFLSTWHSQNFYSHSLVPIHLYTLSSTHLTMHTFIQATCWSTTTKCKKQRSWPVFPQVNPLLPFCFHSGEPPSNCSSPQCPLELGHAPVNIQHTAGRLLFLMSLCFCPMPHLCQNKTLYFGSDLVSIFVSSTSP